MTGRKSGSARAATKRVTEYFESHLGEVVSREAIVELGGEQRDPLKRVRRNGGAREHLDPKGIAVLQGAGDRAVIEQLGLGPVGPDEFVAYKPKTQGELDLLKARRHGKLQSPGFE